MYMPEEEEKAALDTHIHHAKPLVLTNSRDRQSLHATTPLYHPYNIRNSSLLTLCEEERLCEG